LISCHGGAKDSCEAVGAQFATIARADLTAAKADEATERAVSDQIPALRDSLVAVCKDGKWSQAIRDCLAKAADHPAILACEAGLTDDQRKAIDKASRGEPTDDNH
jgi:hypothetical protein